MSIRVARLMVMKKGHQPILMTAALYEYWPKIFPVKTGEFEGLIAYEAACYPLIRPADVLFWIDEAAKPAFPQVAVILRDYV